MKRTYSEYTGDVLAAGVDDIRGQDRTDGKLLIPKHREYDQKVRQDGKMIILLTDLLKIKGFCQLHQ